MKRTVSTCQPGGTIQYDLTREQDREWFRQAVEDGAVTESPEGTVRWCNAHTAVWGSKACQRAAIVVDDAHPQYGTPATLLYPQDRYPYVVVGGAKSGHYLFVAPVAYGNLPMTSEGTHNGFPVNDRTYSKDECIANIRFAGATRITRGKDGKYSDHGTPFSVGVARYRRDWSD